MHRTPVADVSAEMNEVLIKGWVSNIRNQGSIAFLNIRDGTGEIQATIKEDFAPQVLNKVSDLTRESVIGISGSVERHEKAPGGVEIKPTSLTVISKADTPLPLDPSDNTNATQETRLDYRYLDLRRPEIASIFSVVQSVTDTYAEFMSQRRFKEIYPPIIIGSASEGGSELFTLPYFNREAYLAQSPQLYKQMCVVGGMERVFDVTKIFRAEKSRTRKHMTESIQLDMEMGFADSEEVIEIAIAVFEEITEQLIKNHQDDLNTIGSTIDVEPTEWLSYSEAVDLLQENGIKIVWGDDFSSEAEKELCEIVGWDTPLIVDEWPNEVRPFYQMPKDDEVSESFDFIFRGIELSSGGQRIHKPALLEEQIRNEGLNVSQFQSYIDTFRYGAPPHAGWAIGLERLVMTLLELDNIREAALFPRDPDRLTP